jgi:uncharacterized membrane protein
MLTVQVIPEKIHALQHMLKITYGLLFVAAGADKFFNFTTQWSQYLSPVIAQALAPFLSASSLMHGIGIAEIILGIALLTKWTRMGAYAAVIWLLIIVGNLLTMGTFYDIAIRDIVMAVGAYVLAQLTTLKLKYH